MTALVGPNGSGKSTVLRALARLHRPDQGDLLLDDGSSALALSAREFACRVTLLAQTRPVPTGVTVRDVVGYGRHPYRRRWRGGDPDGARVIRWAMAVTGVAELADRSVDQLSGGERQMLAIARMLMSRPKLLMLDEPSLGLAPLIVREVFKTIVELSRSGVSILLVEQNAAAALEISQYAYVLEMGQVTKEGPAATLRKDPELAATYLGLDDKGSGL